VADRQMRLVQRLGRAGLAACAELVVWVQSDRDEARRRGLTRDVELGRSSEEAAAFWDEWMQAEEPFLAADWPWSRTSLVVNGTPPEEMRTRTFLARGPLGHRFAAHVVPPAAPKTDTQGSVIVVIIIIIALPSLFGDRRSANAAPRLLRPPRCSRRRADPGSLRRGLWSGQCVWWPKRSPRRSGRALHVWSRRGGRVPAAVRGFQR
jgi:hypothetical protein